MEFEINYIFAVFSRMYLFIFSKVCLDIFGRFG